MIADLVTAFNALPPPTASFLGTLVGSSLSLVVVLAGALYNARLNRNRDDRLRATERDSIRLALRSELTITRRFLANNAENVRKRGEESPEKRHYIPDIYAMFVVFPKLNDKIQLLSAPQVNAVLRAYIASRMLTEVLMSYSDGATRPHEDAQTFLILPPKLRETYLKQNDDLIGWFDKAIETLK